VDSIPENRSSEDYNAFRDANGFWNPIFLPGQILNTAMVSRPQTDQEGVAGWRNGDGRFYDLGPLSLGPALNHANTLSLSPNNGLTQTDFTLKSKYFNPVLGLPLKCQEVSCADPIIGADNDNTKISTSYFFPNIKPVELDPIPAIQDFFIGNSNITHLGVSEFTFPASGATPVVVPDLGQPVANNYSEILVSLTLSDPIVRTVEQVVTKSFPEDFTPGANLEIYKVIWDVERESEFGVVSGGRSSDLGAGRYTASLTRNYLFSGTNANDPTAGVRCSILINQDD
jgi:hypothetical protein